MSNDAVAVSLSSHLQPGHRHSVPKQPTKKRMREHCFVTFFANDSATGVRVHIDDLQPMSRMRCAIIEDKLSEFECGFSKDVLLSILATYRNNRLILKPGASRLEVLLEIDRDCVVLRLASHHPLEQMTQRICDALASGIHEWPMLWRSFETSLTGGRSDFFCTALHCYIEFPSKPVVDWTRDSKLRQSFTDHVYAHMIETECNCQTVEELKVSHPDGLTLLPTFWWLKHDKGTVYDRSAPMKAFYIHIFSATNDDDMWCSKMRATMQREYSRIPDVSRILEDRRSRSFEMCRESFAAKHLALKHDTGAHDKSKKAVVFTTMWYAWRGHSPRFLLEIDSGCRVGNTS